MKHVKLFEAFVHDTGVKENLMRRFWHKLFGLKKGDFIVRDSTYSSNIFLLLEDIKIDDQWIKVFKIGNFSKNFKGKKYCSLSYNTEDGRNVISKIRSNSSDFKSYRKLTKEEFILLKKSIKSEEYNKYISITKDRTGIDLKTKV